jgi:hypothetical protein
MVCACQFIDLFEVCVATGPDGYTYLVAGDKLSLKGSWVRPFIPPQEWFSILPNTLPVI